MKKEELQKAFNKKYVTSFYISNILKKQHKHVLRDIKEFIKKIKFLNKNNEETQENFEFNIDKYFILKKYKTKNKENREFFILTKKGFLLLIMSYTKITFLENKLLLIEELKKQKGV